MSRVLGLLMVTAPAVLMSSCGPSIFACQSDGACRRGDEAGTCQPDGYCSFPDDACESGQRYGEHAGEDLAQTCVPHQPDEDTGRTTVAHEETSGSSETLEATTSGEATTDATATATATTTGLDGSSSTTESPGSDSATTETGDPPLPCPFTDDFEGAALGDVWMTWTNGGAAVQVANGLLEFVLPPGGGNANAITAVGDLTGMSVTTWLGYVAASDSMVEQDFMLEAEGVSLRISVRGAGILVATWDGTWTSLANGDPAVAGDRLRFSHVDGQLVAEHHSMMGGWHELWSGPPPIELDDVELRFRGFGPHDDGGHPSFAAVEVCPVQ